MELTSKILIITLSVINTCHSSKLLDPFLPEDGRLSFSGLAEKYGHSAETFNITTADGYILALYHIPGDNDKHVLLAHGNTASADCWIQRGNTSLAIILANLGYDVWAINFRGVTESRKHVSLNPDTQSERFYNYTFYEQGIYDFPAAVDYILNQTQQEQLLAIGHSIGTTSFYVMCSEKPEYNDKISLFISLAPICYLEDIKGLALLGINVSDPLIPIAPAELVGENQLATTTFRSSCLGPLGYEVCVRQVFFRIFGPDEDGFEKEFLPIFIGHYPNASSKKMLQHLIQVYRRNEFAKYDYGSTRNMIQYQSPEPPLINLKKVTTKVALFVGRQDYLSTVKDVETLSQQLPNVIYKLIMPYPQFNHFDFVWGRNMQSNLYPFVLPLVKDYWPIN